MKWGWAIGCCVMIGVAAALVGCGAQLQPTEAPPTQTPWIVVVTATLAPGGIGGCPTSFCPTQTPWIVVATPTARRAAASVTRQAPTKTPTAVPAAIKYPAPTLAEPLPRQQVAWHTVVLFKWTPVGTLAADEFYHLHLERRPGAAGQSWYGDYVLTRDTQFRADETFLAPFHPPAAEGVGTVHWWVRVVRQTGVDQNGKPIGLDVSMSSEERVLLLDPKPSDS
ncbi:MAG: hypothetical protein JXA93_20430 [Anaerolineae bacterium]|nr:hypothetical protein [Anaerolineae bacterium]